MEGPMAISIPISRIIQSRRQFAEFSRRANAEGTTLLSGYISSSDDDHVRLEIDPNSDEYLHIPRNAVDCIWQPDDDRIPMLVVLRSVTGVLRNGKAIVEDAPYEADPAARIMALRRLMNEGGGGGAKDCAAEKLTCRSDCSNKFPESGDSPDNLNGSQREACLDNCDVVERLCKYGQGGGFGGGGVFIA
jgi:hypothetical protein